MRPGLLSIRGGTRNQTTDAQCSGPAPVMGSTDSSEYRLASICHHWRGVKLVAQDKHRACTKHSILILAAFPVSRARAKMPFLKIYSASAVGS